MKLSNVATAALVGGAAAQSASSTSLVNCAFGDGEIVPSQVSCISGGTPVSYTRAPITATPTMTQLGDCIFGNHGQYTVKSQASCVNGGTFSPYASSTPTPSMTSASTGTQPMSTTGSVQPSQATVSGAARNIRRDLMAAAGAAMAAGAMAL